MDLAETSITIRTTGSYAGTKRVAEIFLFNCFLFYMDRKVVRVIHWAPLHADGKTRLTKGITAYGGTFTVRRNLFLVYCIQKNVQRL